MNKDRIKEVIGKLRALPEENFCYEEVFRNDECGTVGCVAGWICEWYSPVTNDRLDTARDLLGLCERDSYLLFLANCGRANREDAIKRLEWLLEHGSLEYYPFEEESYGVL